MKLNPAIVYYPGDPAARGTAEILENEYGIKVLQIPKDAPFYDFEDVESKVIIVLSRHKSVKEVKSFTVHFPGNISPSADLGGKPRELSLAFPTLGCKLLQALKTAASDVPEYQVTYEATHHGPTINKAIIFIEIGSTEKQWKERKNHEVLAEAIATYDDYNPSNEKTVWIGGPHYSSRASKRCLEQGIRFGHIAAKYAVEHIDKDMFLKIVSKNIENIEKIYIEKKSVKAERRKEMISWANELGIESVIV